MTDRLADLLAHEADLVDVPPPRAARVLGQGRRLRRRRHAVGGGAVAAAVAVVATAAVLVGGGGGGEVRLDPAGPPTSTATTAATSATRVAGMGAVFAIGNRVHLDGGARSVEIEGSSVIGTYYTSAGVVVGHGDASLEGPDAGPVRFSLVRPDAVVVPLSVEADPELLYASDPAQPYLVVTGTDGGVATLTIWDVVADEMASRVPVLALTGSPLARPSLWQDTVYVPDIDGGVIHEVDWRTGEATVSGAGDFGRVAGGRAVLGGGERLAVVDVTTGRTVLDLGPDDGSSGLVLSPDGRYAAVDTPRRGVVVHDLDAATEVDLRTLSSYFAWTAGGDLFTVSAEGELATCSPATGRCTTTRPDLEVLPGELATAQVDPRASCVAPFCRDNPRDDLVLVGDRVDR